MGKHKDKNRKGRILKNTKSSTTVSTPDGGTITITDKESGGFTIDVVRGHKELPDERKYRIQHKLHSGLEDKTPKHEKRNRTRSSKNQKAIRDSLKFY